MRRPGLFLVLSALLLCRAQTTFAQSDERVLYASVLDKNGEPVPNLTDKDFIVREDGQAREILRVTPDHDPLQIALLIDNSAAMIDHVSELRQAASAFIENTREGVEVALVTMGDRPTVAVPYTSDRAALKKAIDSLFPMPGAGNYMLDAIAETVDGLEERTSRRPVIAVITGTTELSYRHYEEVLSRLHDSGAVLHVIALGTSNGGVDREVTIGRGTSETGGRNEVVLAAMGLAPKSAQLAKEISSQYRITFARPQRLIPPKTTVVSVRNPDWRARGLLLKTEKERR